MTIGKDGVGAFGVTKVRGGFRAVRADVVKFLQPRMLRRGGRLKGLHLRGVGQHGEVGGCWITFVEIVRADSIKPMKSIFVGVLLALVGVIGCSKQESATPPAQRQQTKLPPAPKLLPKVEAANQRYGAIAYSMNRPEVLRSLGTPQLTNGEGAFVWQTSEGQQTARLTLKFKSDGKMTERNVEVQYSEPPK